MELLSLLGYCREINCSSNRIYPLSYNGVCVIGPGLVAARKRTSTPEHALASETPTAMSKGLCQTGHGDVRP